MFWLKACPRCQGDLHQEQDQYGPYIACLQCGYALTSMEEEALRNNGRIEGEVVSGTGTAAQSKVA